jgi:hypothetical protein
MSFAGTPQLVSLGRWSACPAASVLAGPSDCLLPEQFSFSDARDPATRLQLVGDGSLLWIKLESLVGCRYVASWYQHDAD